MRVLRLAAVLGLITLPVLAQTVLRGDALRRREYATQQDLTLFVDGTLGNDTNACTASGSNACQTIQAALAKVPQLIRDLVTINIADGNYTGFAIAGYTFQPRNNTSAKGLLIQGNLVNYTPATGTATGTLTSVVNVATNAAGLRTVTDSGQSWTTNDLRGKLFVATGGGGSGNNRVIASNTATTLTLVAGAESTAFAAGTTYSIQQPGAVITTGISGPATATAAGSSGFGFWIGGTTSSRSSASNPAIQIQRIWVNVSGGTLTPGIGIFGAATTARLINVNSTVSGAGASAINITEGFEVRIGQSFFSSSATNGQALLLGSTNTVPTLRSDQNYFLSTGTNTATFGGAANILGLGTKFILNTDRSFFECTATAGSTSACVGVREGAQMESLSQNGGPQITGNGVGACLELGRTQSTAGTLTSGPASTPMPAIGLASGTGLTNCEVGLRLTSLSMARLMTGQFTTMTTGISTRGGGRVEFIGGGAFTYTTVTNELQVDGDNYTQAAFEALPVQAIYNLYYGSSIARL